MLRRSFDGAVAPSKSIQQHRRDPQRAGPRCGSTHFLGPQRLIDLAPRPEREHAALWHSRLHLVKEHPEEQRLEILTRAPEALAVLISVASVLQRRR
jgi:hypothetical protein